MIDPTLPPALLADLETALRQLYGNDFRLHTARKGPSSSSLQTLIIGDGKQQYFIKYGSAAAHAALAAASDGLLALAGPLNESGLARVPRPLLHVHNQDQDHAFLVSEYFPLQPLAAASGARLAEALVLLHRHEGEQFGWDRDNFIGATPQANSRHHNWALFFVDQRLRPQLELARQNGYERELIRQGERLYERIPALFLDYRPRCSLLHGDLWHGNVAQLADGTPLIFDPAVHYGDRESDLAMSELFGGFPPGFYAEYRRQWPLAEDYEWRKPLYSLYHILNHLNLFGRSYLREALRLTSKLNSALSRRA